MTWLAVAPVAPAAEPVSIDQAKIQCRLTADDHDHDAALAVYCAAARLHVEAYTGLVLAPRTLTARCTSFADLARLPFAPAIAIESIAYVDADGEDQVLDAELYALRADPFEGAVLLAAGASWPAIARGSLITVAASAGAEPEGSVLLAMLLLVGQWFANREPMNVGNIVSPLPNSVDALLVNHRRYA